MRPATAGGAAAFLAEARERVDGTLESLLPPETEAPTRLHQAMRYPVFAGGKRLRPALLLATVRSLGGDETRALVPAAALELIHTYSLVHDDLPAMDDDDLRRGRPTCHVAFDEATAVLVGDALLTLAFEVVVTRTDAPAEVRCSLLREISVAIGSQGMVGGQALDLEAEGKRLDGAGLEQIHRWKTGALIRASVVSGGYLAGGSDEEMDALRRFGEAIGLAFQIVDDLLDVQGDSAVLGKTAGKDARAEKATFPAIWGLEESRRRARTTVEEARAALHPLGDAGTPLLDLAGFVMDRDR
jgi:geranylgeranyl pyrophosphate synthase